MSSAGPQRSAFSTLAELSKCGASALGFCSSQEGAPPKGGLLLSGSPAPQRPWDRGRDVSAEWDPGNRGTDAGPLLKSVREPFGPRLLAFADDCEVNKIRQPFGPRLASSCGNRHSFLQMPRADMSHISPEEDVLSDSRSTASGGVVSPTATLTSDASSDVAPTSILATPKPLLLMASRKNGYQAVDNASRMPLQRLMAGEHDADVVAALTFSPDFRRIPVDLPVTPLHPSASAELQDVDEHSPGVPADRPPPCLTSHGGQCSPVGGRSYDMGEVPEEHPLRVCQHLDSEEMSPSSMTRKGSVQASRGGCFGPGALAQLADIRSVARPLRCGGGCGSPVATSKRVPSSPAKLGSRELARRSLQSLIVAEAAALSCPEATSDLESKPSTPARAERQLIADACRARYVIDGEELWFAKEAEELSSLKKDPLKDPSVPFPQRVHAAVVSCVEGSGRGPNQPPLPEGFMSVVMLLLTQIGLALASLACAGPRLALCGGLREITYELERVGWSQWTIRSKFCAKGFKQFQEAGSLDVASSCDPSSSMTRAFSVKLVLTTESQVGFHVNVQDVFERIAIVDMRGLPVTLAPCSSDLIGTPRRQGQESPSKRLGGMQGCHHGLLVQCSAGRCGSAPQTGGAPTSLWSQISGACAHGPDLYEDPSAGEVRVS